MFEQLCRELSALPQVEAMALGGSRAGDHYDEKSDYDLYVYVTEPISEEVRRPILERCCSYMEIGNHFWEYEDNCTLKNGIDIDILWRDLDDFTAGVAVVVEEFRPSNCYTTCMWHNLRTCKILYDRAGRLKAAKDRFDVPYPEELKRNIVERSLKLLRGTMPAFDGQIEKAVRRGDRVSINHRVTEFLASYFDILFALNGQTHPGEKRLVSLCRECCPVLPEGFGENLDALFTHMGADPHQVPVDIRRIVAELEKIL